MLAALWTLSNNADKVRWAARMECKDEIHQREEEENIQLQQALQEEEEAARLEEQKKNKSKYTSIHRGKVPSTLSILPAIYTIRKLKGSPLSPTLSGTPNQDPGHHTRSTRPTASPTVFHPINRTLKKPKNIL
ncbi:hypothetical protein DEU56DRAFT_761852 [Suillus clintonianus]|uniref:uncharacterized protein n=1 Tax=Suillus clintonianus TaxID=1904413 RepID=UPI001B87108A|nr:uncharacterized protein DEU56DRAFT_761852 [Suillus clintonianus]KAG2114396.1 hypothetical protein DEU56DRAFT_761852 [Suillus clintonianus]